MPKFICDLDDDLHEFLKEQKTLQKIPMNEIINRLVRRYQMELDRNKKR